MKGGIALLLEKERTLVAEYGRKLLAEGLTRGTGGNLSVADRHAGLAAVKPSAVAYPETGPADIAVVDFEGRQVDGPWKPSSETPMHLALYRGRPDVGAVVHTHSPFATTFACLGREIPAVHYLLAMAGGRVPCTPYVPFGTEELASSALAGIGGGHAVLLGHHGLVAVGADMAEAFAVAWAVEFAAEIAWRASCLGSPPEIPQALMEDAVARMARYGRSAPAGKEDSR